MSHVGVMVNILFIYVVVSERRRSLSFCKILLPLMRRKFARVRSVQGDMGNYAALNGHAASALLADIDVDIDWTRWK